MRSLFGNEETVLASDKRIIPKVLLLRKNRKRSKKRQGYLYARCSASSTRALNA